MRKISGLLTTFLHGGDIEEEIRFFQPPLSMEEADGEKIRFVNHFSQWMRKMRKISGLLTTPLYGGGRCGRDQSC